MPGKRATTPLFDLLQQGRARRAEVVASAQPDAPAEADEAAAEREPKATGVAEAPIRIVGGVVQMPLIYAAVLVAVAGVAVLMAWSLGYRRGENEVRSEQRLLESAMGTGGQIVEPGTVGPGGDAASRQPAGTGSPGSQGGEHQPTNTNQPRSIPTVGLASFLTSVGGTETDPRLTMHNYLQLGSLIRPAEIESAIAFLGSRGLDCFGVIDPGSLGRNDGPLYVLFASLGFPSGEANSAEARRYREQVVAAGAAWKQAGGVRDFDDAGWALHKR